MYTSRDQTTLVKTAPSENGNTPTCTAWHQIEQRARVIKLFRTPKYDKYTLRLEHTRNISIWIWFPGTCWNIDQFTICRTPVLHSAARSHSAEQMIRFGVCPKMLMQITLLECQQCQFRSVLTIENLQWKKTITRPNDEIMLQETHGHTRK